MKIGNWAGNHTDALPCLLTCWPSASAAGQSFNVYKTPSPVNSPSNLIAFELDPTPPPIANFSCSGTSATKSFHGTGMSFVEIRFLPAPESTKNSWWNRDGVQTAAKAAKHLMAFSNIIGFGNALHPLSLFTGLACLRTLIDPCPPTDLFPKLLANPGN